jgi:hypothetical protein
VCELYSYRKVYLDIKITRHVYDSYVLFDEASPCPLEDIYEVLILCYRRPLSVEHHSSGSINLNTEQDPVIAFDTHIQLKCWIYLLSNWRDENRVEVCCLSKALNTLFSVRFGHLFTLFSFIRFHKSRCDNTPFFGILSPSSYMIQKKEGMRKHISSWAII